VQRFLIIATALVAFVVLRAAHAQDSANGIFLVAQPSLTEPTFHRTVILITHLPRMGPIGVIINRPTEIALSEAFPKHENIAALSHSLYFGGPVAPQNVMFLVRADSSPPRSIAVLQDVYLTADADWVNAALGESKLPAVRVLAGYSGWAPGQLQNELKREGWYMLPADAETIFDKDLSTVWAELVKRAVLRPTSTNNTQ
jgi:putative transcriptional regulator